MLEGLGKGESSWVDTYETEIRAFSGCSVAMKPSVLPVEVHLRQ